MSLPPVLEFDDGDIQAAAGAEPQLAPLERLELLCDPGSVHPIRTRVRSRSLADDAGAGDGVVGAWGTVFGRPVLCYAEDGRCAGGSLGEAHAQTILRVFELAKSAAVPVVGFVESAGARLQEGTAALNAYARLFRKSVELSGHVPQIAVLTGTSAGGGCYGPALMDFVVMTKQARMFLTGPRVVRDVTGERVSAEELGGSAVHQANGVAHFVVPGVVDAAVLVRNLLSYLPQNAGDEPPWAISSNGSRLSPADSVPPELQRVYDVRDVIEATVDSASFLEVGAKWARNMVTGLARLDGRPLGIVANQPRYLGGVIDVAASQKAARFVRTCNAFGLALLVLVDTPGFLPGETQESAGIIRHGATLLHAFAEASVPKVTLVLRQAYGGGYITMNSLGLGADLTFAWDGGRIGVMGAQQAVGIVHRRRIAAAADPDAERQRLAHAYAEQYLPTRIAAEEGHIDGLLEPSETRERLCAAFATLVGKDRPPPPSVKNIPL